MEVVNFVCLNSDEHAFLLFLRRLQMSGSCCINALENWMKQIP